MTSFTVAPSFAVAHSECVFPWQVFLGCENMSNLFTVQRKLSPATPEEGRRLDTVAEFHLGEFVNKFRAGSLVLKIPDSTSVCMYPSMLFGTVTGSIGLIVQLPEKVFEKLGKLQSNLSRLIESVGGFKHGQWRAFCSERRTHDARGFVDGDLIERLLELPAETAAEAVNGTNSSVDEMMLLVDELSRLH